MKTRVFAVLMAIVFTFCNFTVLYADDTTDTEIEDSGFDENYYSPGIEVDPNPSLKMSSDGMVEMDAGEEREVVVKIKNVSSFYAYNVLVQATAGTGTVPFSMQFMDKSNIKNYLQNTATMSVRMKFKIDKDAKAGTYPITLNYSCNAQNKNAFTGTDTLLLKISSGSTTPTVTLNDITSDKNSVKAGEGFNLSMQLKNSDAVAKDVTVIIDGLTAATVGMNSGSSTRVFKSMDKNQSEDLSFDMTTFKNLETGSYPFTIKLSYKDGGDTAYTKDYGFFINVKAKDDSDSDSKPDLTATITDPSGTFGVGQTFRVGLTVKNTSDKTANNILISHISGENDVIVPRSSSVTQIKSLKPGEQKTLNFDFSATDEADTKNYPIGFEIEYETGVSKEGVAETKKFKQYSNANISNPDKKKEGEEGDDKKISKPKIIISKYASNPVMVEAGEKFDLTMTFKNTHATKSVENIKLFITVDDKTEEKGNVFTPDNASNTFYIDKIAPKGEVSHTFKMYTVPDAQARTYTIIVNFEYEDAEHNEYTPQEFVGINVRQPAKLDTSDITIPTEGFVGEPIDIMFDLYNTGKVGLSNLMIKIEGEDFDTSQTTSFIGNLEAGASDYYEGALYPNATGNFDGKLIISYQDSTGEDVAIEREFNVSVSEPDYSDMEEGALDEDVPEEGTNWVKILIGVGIGVVVVIILIVVFRTIIRKRRERELDE